MIRIVTWNIQLGWRLPLILDAITELPAFDVLALQELSGHGAASNAQAIARHLGPDWRGAQVTAQLFRGQHQANGFVWNQSRIKVMDVSSIPLPTPSGRAMRRLPPSRRNAAVMEAQMGDHRLRLYSVHLDVFGIAHKHAQLACVLADATQRAAVDLTVISGDMNTYGVAGRPRWSELRRLASAAGFEELTMGIGWTQRRLGVRQKLDAIFASPGGLPYRRQRIIARGSDHVPLWVEMPFGA
jgi:endonuclease/exonuclease/phosphatase family metal-dependent hydrolase